ncbi:MAG TPA: hypothetical protein VFJ20_06005 [Gemmatimonadaceae bacterium]|nr:hypothetical protein [Gemmatimonadaceae bacterium]
MNEELKKAVQKAQAATQQAFTKERGAFKSLLLANPNYFGNLADSPFKSVLSLQGNTFYEDLGCVGYHPQQRRLEGVVYINQPSGYGSDVCGSGTSEFVRFYLSFDHGATWVDQGMTSFQAYNIPAGTEGSKRLEYAVSLVPHVPLRFCVSELLVRVRAILSWNNPPPPNQPNWAPIWGNVREVTVLIEPLRLIPPKHLFELAKVKVPPLVDELIDLDAPIATKKKTLGAAELASVYKDKGVPLHRFAFKELSAFVTSSAALSAESFLSQLPGIQIDPGIGGLLFPTDGDVSYEELKCIGLDPNHPDTLVGVIQAKKASGYSGGPCTSGSKEYVTFWADFDNNGSFETCLGTADVTVYDVAGIPPQGIYYAVRLPVDLTARRKSCKEGANVVRIRAILSWSVAAPCANPNKVPTWGNREETLINIAPATQEPAGKIAILGGIPVSMIDGTTGLTTPTAVFATNNQAPDSLFRPCPFAARVSVQGAPIPGYTYQVEVSPDNNVFTPVLTDLVVTDQFGNTSPHKANNVTKRFDYLPFTSNVNALLAEWDTSGDALWYVRLSVYDGGGVFQGSDTHVIQLDNTWPEVSIDITTGLGNCGKFMPGEALAGTFVARDTYLGSYSLGVEPNVNVPPIGVPVPSSGNVNTAAAPGDPWSLDTTNMQPCGYVIRVVAVDRAIVNSQSVGHQSPASAGFCLEAPESV